ncbi:hypothetical protein DFH27DRAFT_194283 [Peziza echinospora]|nr:hypothetical protein DFH27DRAFT_194283 [Peziza echinospora]
MPPDADALYQATLLRAAEERQAAIDQVRHIIATQIHDTWVEDWEASNLHSGRLAGAAGTHVPQVMNPGYVRPPPLNGAASVGCEEEVTEADLREVERRDCGECGDGGDGEVDLLVGNQALDDDSDLLREADMYVVKNPPPLPTESSASGNGNGNGGVYRYQSPDEITPLAATAKRHENLGIKVLRARNRRLLREEICWNKGLETWVLRRRDWTARHNNNTNGGGVGHAPPTSPFEVSPLRASVGPSAYTSIYNKIVKRARTPVVPIGLEHMTRALVQGWKKDGEWPASAAAAEAVVSREDVGGVTSTATAQENGGQGQQGGSIYQLIVRPNNDEPERQQTDGKGGKRISSSGAGGGGGFMGML